ncbi:hypothetical protein RhiirA1_416051 [Rhizophagus irregularis]|uniref:DRBM domain-containing protein n=1 Tax=Rhizophagus irregularis TaxID=588596 RepID=A0A2N0S0S1_9GLOM|nr:hypothetical protein RhiirA1_416051 [Rhizophagus irregularis]
MSEVENSLNALGAQTLFSAMTEGTSSFNQQQQQYQEQQNIDNNSEENSSTSTLTEIPQSPTQLSSEDSVISSSTTLDHSYNSSNLSQSSNSSNSSNLSNSSNSSDSSITLNVPFNPISFLNTLHQKLKTSKPPVYSYSHDSVTGHFYCHVNFCGQTYENKTARSKKQQAKEEAASIAMNDLSLRMPEITDLIRQELVKAHTSLQKANNNKGNNQAVKRPYYSRQSYQQQIIAPHPLELIPKSVQWYQRQVAHASSIGQMKRPCVLLLEFCQMHKLGHPTYTIRDDGSGYYLFDCTVYNRTFNPQLSFWRKSDAKDHVSQIAFQCLYEEFIEKEGQEIQQSYGLSPITSPPPPPPSNMAYPLIYSNVTDGNSYAYFTN